MPGRDVPHLVLGKERDHPLLVLDEGHCGKRGERDCHHPGSQRQRHDRAVGGCVLHGFLELPLRVGELCLGLRDLRQHLGHLLLDAGRRLRSKVFAGLCNARLAAWTSLWYFATSACACSRSKRLPAPLLREFLVFLDPFARESKLRGRDALLARCLLELFAEVAGIGCGRDQFRTQLVDVRLGRADLDLEGHRVELKSTSPFLTALFGSTGTSITLPATRGLIGTT